MKRVKDDEKIMGPMFPRLHVNDADKGGPRAPPRNKMALYEQLSIPSQRFNNHSLLPLNAGNKSNSVLPGSSSQGNGRERNLLFQHQEAPSIPIRPAEKFPAQKPHGVNLTSSVAQSGQRKIVGEENDFMVPVFVNSGTHSRTKHDVHKEKLTLSTPHSFCTSTKIQGANVNESKLSSSLSACIRKEDNEESPKARLSVNSLAYMPAREEMNIDKPASEYNRLNETNACLRQDSTNGFDQDDGETGAKVDSLSNIHNGIEAQIRNESHSGDEVNDNHENCGSGTTVSLQLKNGDASDGVSETSMVDSVSSSDISPDDVVGVIGQKHFWTARRAIANQQRVFAVQVFELHRLIKVQRLIAGSPHLLLEDSGAYFGKSSCKPCPTTKLLPPEYVVKSLPRVIKRKGDSDKADNNNKMECSAENAVGRTTSLSSAKSNAQQPFGFPPFAGNHPPAPVASDTQTGGGGGGTWCFPPQPTHGNHQWLIPVMSPSEGLVYKPFPAPPGYTGPVCGGYYGHLPPIPMMSSNFAGPPAYGIPASPYPQGVGYPATGQGYFPACGIPGMSPYFSGQPTEQINPFGHPDTPLSALNMQQQSSCKLPAGKNGAMDGTQATMYQMGEKETNQVQGSRVSSPTERGARQNGDISRNALPHSQTAAVVENSGSKVTEEQRPTTRVIRVVPHKPTLATECAARIFLSIQQERRQYGTA